MSHPALRLEEIKNREKAKAEALRLRNIAEYNKVKDAIRELKGNKNFQIVLRHMAKICGFWKPSTVLNPSTSEINPYSTIQNEGRRNVYLDFRRMMDDDTRRQIETKDEETRHEDVPDL
jgi:hypothetical protein